MSDTTTPTPETPTSGEPVATIAPPSDRPDYLQEKFESVEAQAKAYVDLQKKLGESTQEPEAPVEPPPPAKSVDELLERAGVNGEELRNTFLEQGALSEEQYDKLNASGYPKDVVDNYLQGQAATAQKQFNEVFADVPTKGSDWQDVSQWAQTGLAEDARNAFNETMNTGTVEQQRLAVRDLYAKHKAAVGTEGNLLSGNPVPTTGERYESKDQFRIDIRNPMYAKDEAFRNKVLAKAQRSGFA